MSQIDPEDIKSHRVLYLVSWVEMNGNIRGQTQKDMESAKRLYEHVTGQDNVQYAEVRKIGAIVNNMLHKREVIEQQKETVQ